MTALLRVIVGSVPVIAGLVGAAFFIPPDFPLLLRQALLFVWGVGGIFVAERLLFHTDVFRIPANLGFVAPRWRAVIVAILVSLPMWLFVPLIGWATGTPIALNAAWLPILLGVVLVNGLTEEVVHRAYIFGHLRKEWSFLAAATISAAIFGAQHLYLLLTMGTVAGLASVGLAVVIAYPFALLYDRGGNSLAGPAILHTSSNAPMMLLVPAEGAATVILPHMAVVLISMYLSFFFSRWMKEAG